jgi:hypothetical protein
MNAPLCSQDPLRQPRKCELPRPLVCWTPADYTPKTRAEWSEDLRIPFPPRGTEKGSLKPMGQYSYETEMS